MQPFLKQVADHYCMFPDIDKFCFVFPNRRSMAFFSVHLRKNVSDSAMSGTGSVAGPVCMPRMLTVSDFFHEAAGLRTADRVTLLLELYDCWCRVNPKPESLDDFINWGDVLLADFNDVDKYLVNPEGLYRNVSDFKEIQDDYSHLDPEQLKAVEEFLSHFRDRESRSLRPEAEGNSVKGSFLKIWDLLLPLYREFNRTLEEKGLAYDGMVYRKMAQTLKGNAALDFFSQRFPLCSRFVFVGLNALNEAEKTVLSKMRNAEMAEFCWDYSSQMIRNLKGVPSQYMKHNVEDFPQTWQLDPEGLPQPEFNVLSVPSSAGQAKMLPSVLGKLGISDNPECTDCAIVLPDEGLLMSVLNSIPEHISSVNVTMGYPMGASSIWSLMSEICRLQMSVRRNSEGTAFYHRQVSAIFSNGLFGSIADDASRAIMAKVREDAAFYVKEADLKGSPLMDMVFRPVLTEATRADAAQIEAFAAYQQEVLSLVASLIASDENLAVETEFAKRYYSCVNLLKGRKVAMLPRTYVSLLARIASGESVPFEGEPLSGLQVMGPLETRCLDFDNVVILSCNEGLFPKKNSSTSFIPPELRRGFGLPTNEFKDAILAYNFYRLIQRTGKVWLVYDSRTDKTGSGEESRYIKQLEYHFRVPVKRHVADCGISLPVNGRSVEKPSDIKKIIGDKNLSASSLETYLKCQLKFYYSFVCGLKPETEITESLDGSMVGRIYHAVMQALYMGEEAMKPDFSMDRKNIRDALESKRIQPLAKVTYSYLESWMGRTGVVKAKIRSLVKAELRRNEVSGRDLVMEEVILMYVMNTIKKDMEYLKDNGAAHFNILGLELPAQWKWNGYSFFGYIDRLDCLDSGPVRVVDYKTGKVDDNELSLTDDNAEKVVENLFAPAENERPRPLIALQLFLYDKFVGGMKGFSGKPLRNAIYQVSSLFTRSVSELEVAQSNIFMALCENGLESVLAELTDKSEPFKATCNPKVCEYCDFKNICKASL